MTPPTDHHQEPCEHCIHHDTQEFRIAQLERQYTELYGCYTAIKNNIGTINTNQAVLTQKFENLKIPIWVIFGVALTQAAKMLFSFAPRITEAVEVSWILNF